MEEARNLLIVDIYPVELEYFDGFRVHVKDLVLVGINVERGDRGVEELEVGRRQRPFILAHSTDVLAKLFLLQEVHHELHVHFNNPEVEEVTFQNPHKQLLQVLNLFVSIVAVLHKYIYTRLLHLQLNQKSFERGNNFVELSEELGL